MRVARWIAYAVGGILMAVWIFTQTAWSLIASLVLIFGAVISSGPEDRTTHPEEKERR